jgi:hypothetical protein
VSSQVGRRGVFVRDKGVAKAPSIATCRRPGPPPHWPASLPAEEWQKRVMRAMRPAEILQSVVGERGNDDATAGNHLKQSSLEVGALISGDQIAALATVRGRRYGGPPPQMARRGSATVTCYGSAGHRRGKVERPHEVARCADVKGA